MRLAGGVRQQGAEGFLVPVSGVREQLFQLIHEQQTRTASRRDDIFRNALWRFLKRRRDFYRRLLGVCWQHADQPDGQRQEGVITQGAGHAGDHTPVLAAREGAILKTRDQAGADERRFAGTGGADHREEALSGVAQSSDQGINFTSTAIKDRSFLWREGPQARIW